MTSPPVSTALEGLRLLGVAAPGVAEPQAGGAGRARRRRDRRHRGPGVDGRIRRADLRRRSRGGAGHPDGAAAFHRRLTASDAFIVASPEYNGSMPGGFKNLIDWTSRFRPQPFDGRHGLLMSASPSLVGGNRGLWALRVPFEHLGTRVYPDMFSLSMAHKAFAGDDLADAALRARFDTDRAGVPVAGRGGRALPVHEAGVGRVPGRAARAGRRSRRRGVGQSAWDRRHSARVPVDDHRRVGAVLGGPVHQDPLPVVAHGVVAPELRRRDPGPTS